MNELYWFSVSSMENPFVILETPFVILENLFALLEMQVEDCADVVIVLSCLLIQGWDQ